MVRFEGYRDDQGVRRCSGGIMTKIQSADESAAKQVVIGVVPIAYVPFGIRAIDWSREQAILTIS